MAVVGVRGKDSVVLGVEKRAAAKLQDTRTVKKIAPLDKHIMVAFSGLTADARVLINRARVECQSHRLTVEDEPSVEYISRWIAGVQQRYTQRGGVRPFGVSAIVAGFDKEGNPALYKTEPSGSYFAWKATCTGIYILILVRSVPLRRCSGKQDKEVREYLEKNYGEGELSGDEAKKLAIRALLEVSVLTNTIIQTSNRFLELGG